MKVINANNEKTLLPEESCVIIGNFDGVHLGHQKLIKEAKDNFKTCAVLTFTPHPQEVIRNKTFKTIMTLEEKLQIFEELQVDYVLLFDFNDEIMTMSKELFISKLKDFNVKNIICGNDYRFGHKASGDVNDLRENFDVIVIDNYEVDGIRISSTYIKKLIKEDIELVNKYLGKPYSICSKVIHGNKIGRKIGFPTANLEIKDHLILKEGVYICTVLVDSIKYLAITNIGYNPTLNSSEDIKIEVHIIDFNKDIYNKYIKVHFLKYIREEKNFNNKEELLEQLQNDLRFAKSNKNIL